MFSALRWRIGRRGAAILVLTGIQIILGSGLFAVPPDAIGALLLINVLPPFVWGVIWVGAGVLSIPFAFMRTGVDRYGFMAQYMPPIIWGFSYLLTSVLGLFPLGIIAGIRGAVIYAGYSALIVIISGMVGFKEVSDQ